MLLLLLLHCRSVGAALNFLAELLVCLAFGSTENGVTSITEHLRRMVTSAHEKVLAVNKRLKVVMTKLQACSQLAGQWLGTWNCSPVLVGSETTWACLCSRCQ